MEFVARYRNRAASVFLSALLFFAVGLPVLRGLGQMIVAWDPLGLNVVFASLLVRSLLTTFIQAVLSSGVSLLLGACLAVGLACFQMGMRLRPAVETLGSFCSLLPGVAVALLCLEFFGAMGVEAMGLAPIVWAHVFMNVFMVGAILSHTLVGDWNAGGRDLYWVWRSLGASSSQAGLRYLRHVFSGDMRRWGALVFVWSAQAFSTVLILGGSSRWLSPEVLLFYTIQQDLLSSRVLVLILVQALLSLAAFSLFRSWTLGGTREGAITRCVDLPIPKTLVGIVSTGILLLFAGPLFWVLVQIANQFRLGGWSSELYRPTALSLGLGLLVAALATLWSYFLSMVHEPVLRACAFLLAVSSTLLSGFWVYLGWDQALSSDLSRLAIVALVLSTLLLPQLATLSRFVTERLSSDHWAAARASGATLWQAHQVLVLPLLRPVLFRSARAGFLVGLGDLGVAILFVPDMNLLPSVARRLASQYDFSASLWILFVMLVGSSFWVLAELLWVRSRSRV
jgi:ABC-type Fe3+ transport system permease subunit